MRVAFLLNDRVKFKMEKESRKFTQPALSNQPFDYIIEAETPPSNPNNEWTVAYKLKDYDPTGNGAGDYPSVSPPAGLRIIDFLTGWTTDQTPVVVYTSLIEDTEFKDPDAVGVYGTFLTNKRLKYNSLTAQIDDVTDDYVDYPLTERRFRDFIFYSTRDILLYQAGYYTPLYMINRFHQYPVREEFFSTLFDSITNYNRTGLWNKRFIKLTDRVPGELKLWSLIGGRPYLNSTFSRLYLTTIIRGSESRIL